MPNSSKASPRHFRAARNAARRAESTKTLRVVSASRGWAQVLHENKYIARHRVVPFRSTRAEVLIVSGDMEGCTARVLSVDEHTTTPTRQNRAGRKVTLATLEYTTGLGYTKSGSFDPIGLHPVEELKTIIKGVGPRPPKAPS